MNLSAEQIKKLDGAASREEALALAGEYGIERTDALRAKVDACFGSSGRGGMTDEDLSGVAGGLLDWGNGAGQGGQKNKEDVVFAFKVGDRVEVKYGCGIFPTTQRGTIVECAVKMLGMRHCPVYYVELDAWYAVNEWYRQTDISY